MSRTYEVVTVKMRMCTEVNEETGEITQKLKPDMGCFWNGKEWSFAPYSIEGGPKGICCKPRKGWDE